MALFLIGCGADKEPQVYEVPKETPQIAPVGLPAATSDAPMAQQSLPQELAGDGESPHWQVPAHWTVAEGSSMRRGSFSVPGTGLDIAVTTFPGDVGGMLANVNRWRDQIGLTRIGEGDLAEANAPIQTGAGPATITSLTGESQSTVAVTLMRGGSSWFFKMTGPTAEVEAERGAFLRFVQSAHFHTHGHSHE